MTASTAVNCTYDDSFGSKLYFKMRPNTTVKVTMKATSAKNNADMLLEALPGLAPGTEMCMSVKDCLQKLAKHTYPMRLATTQQS